MAIIKAVLSFLLGRFFVLGIVGGDGGKRGGEGGGGTGEHGFRGVPHRRELPTKDELGNFWRETGIVPLRWLSLRFKCFNLGRLRSGICPERELFWRFSVVSCVKFRIVKGISALKELKERSRTVRLGEREEGMVPEKLLRWRKRH